eukprot:sb/3461097/
MLCDEEELVTSPHQTTKPAKSGQGPAILDIQTDDGNEPLNQVPEIVAGDSNHSTQCEVKEDFEPEDGVDEEQEIPEDPGENILGDDDALGDDGEDFQDECDSDISLTSDKNMNGQDVVEDTVIDSNQEAVILSSTSPSKNLEAIDPPDDIDEVPHLQINTTECPPDHEPKETSQLTEIVLEGCEELGEDVVQKEDDAIDATEKLAVAEIERAVASSDVSVAQSFGEKIAELSKSVTPPNWGPAKEEAKVMFSSLNNLASRLMEPKPVTSASMNDLDRYSVQPTLSERMRNGRDETLSSISDEIDEMDAYEAVKKESTVLDVRDGSADELRKIIKKLEYELDVANGTIKHVYDESTRRIGEVTKQHEIRVEQINRQFIECIKERDVAKESLAENMDARRKLQANKESLIKNLSNQADENERLRAKLHMSTEDCIKLKKELDMRVYECTEQRKQIKKLNDDLSSAGIKVQWANSKLKSECDAHQSTRTKLSGMDAKIREAKEEANMIRTNCQAMIDKYQNSEEIQSNALGNKLDKLEQEHKNLQGRFDELTKKHGLKCVETEQIMKQMEQIKDQLFDKDSEYQKVLAESRNQESDKNNLANKLEDLDERLNSYNDLKNELKNAYLNNQQLDSELMGIKEKVAYVEKLNSELSEKEKENLEYFQKVGAKNAELTLKLNECCKDRDGSREQLSSLTAKHQQLSTDFESLSSLSKSEAEKASDLIGSLETKVKELEDCKSDLECKLSDMNNNAVVTKRKHQADNKDLLRQIDQFRRQLERQEESMRRTESVTSLESHGRDTRTRSGASSEAEDQSSESSAYTLTMDQARAMLIERLCSLQRALAKRQEKIEFYESHVETLTKDLQKKTRVIQSLLLRVETGERTRLAGEAYKSPLERGAANGDMYQVCHKRENGHEDSIWSVAWARSEKDNTENIITGGVDDLVKSWNWRDDFLEYKSELKGHQLGIVSVTINSAGTVAASSSLDSTIKLWDLDSSKQIKSIDAGPVDCWSVAFSPDGQYIGSGSHSGKINLFGIESGKLEQTLDTRGKFVMSIAYSPDGHFIACGGIDGIVCIFDLATDITYDPSPQISLSPQISPPTSDLIIPSQISTGHLLKMRDLLKQALDIIEVVFGETTTESVASCQHNGPSPICEDPVFSKSPVEPDWRTTPNTCSLSRSEGEDDISDEPSPPSHPTTTTPLPAVEITQLTQELSHLKLCSPLSPTQVTEKRAKDEALARAIRLQKGAKRFGILTTEEQAVAIEAPAEINCAANGRTRNKTKSGDSGRKVFLETVKNSGKE